MSRDDQLTAAAVERVLGTGMANRSDHYATGTLRLIFDRWVLAGSEGIRYTPGEKRCGENSGMRVF